MTKKASNPPPAKAKSKEPPALPLGDVGELLERHSIVNLDDNDRLIQAAVERADKFQADYEGETSAHALTRERHDAAMQALKVQHSEEAIVLRRERDASAQAAAESLARAETAEVTLRAMQTQINELIEKLNAARERVVVLEREVSEWAAAEQGRGA